MTRLSRPKAPFGFRPRPTDSGRVAAAAVALGLALCLPACGTPERGGPVAERLNPAVRSVVAEALTEYETVRAALARDSLEGATGPAAAMAGTLSGIEGQDGQRPALAAEAARRLADATDLDAARRAFADLSRVLIVLASQSTELSGSRYLFLCPMVDGFNQWIQVTDRIENPYMGSRMLRCGSTIPWPPLATESASSAPGAVDIAYYTCPMHPSIRQPEPGPCPICSMDLVPVTQEELRTGTVTVDAERRQRTGVRTAPVVRKTLHKTIRAVGRVVADETALADVSLKFGGWIGELHADASGVRVRKGSPLLTIYSPDLLTAQEEYLTALRSREAARGTSAPDRADYLVEAARARLELWDLTKAQIDEIGSRGEARRFFPILSPVSGYVVEKDVVPGGRVEPGMRLYRIADLDRIWIEADFYEAESAWIAVGRRVRVSLSYGDTGPRDGTISFVYPYLDGRTRTIRARIELANPDLEIKPDMFANVELDAEHGSRLSVPESAILYAGARQFVFLDLGGGKLRPRAVELGLRAGDDVEVLSGLAEGDVIVVSGNFLIAAESRLKTALEQW